MRFYNKSKSLDIKIDKDSIKLISFRVSEIEKIDLSPLHPRLGLVTSNSRFRGREIQGFFFQSDADEPKLDKRINNICSL